MTSFSAESLLRLISVPGIGPARMRTLVTAFESPQAVLDAPIQYLMRVKGIEKATAAKIKQQVDQTWVDQQLQAIDAEGARLLSYWDKNYPQSLKQIFDPPVLLFAKGTIPNSEPAIGVVGTRVPSSYGKSVTERFVRELAEAGMAIVSGLARGVDTIAHKTALKYGAKTVAVLGCGIDCVYPSENKGLAGDIIHQGAVISEYAMGAKPDAGNFPRRNRIISGLSLGVIITEAGAKSGALITAFQALEQNREVFAVPGPIHSGKSAGSNRLIKDGAKLVQGTQDILLELEGQLSGKVITRPQPEPHLTGKEKTVYDNLSNEAQHVDALADKCRFSTAEILSILLTLELMGVVKQLSGKMFIKL